MPDINLEMSETVIHIEMSEGLAQVSSRALVHQAIAGETLSSMKAIVVIDGEMFLADPTDIAHAGVIAGVSRQAGDAGNTITYVSEGELVTSGLTAGEEYFVGLNGALSLTPIAVGAVWMQKVGLAVSSVKLLVSPDSVVVL